MGVVRHLGRTRRSAVKLPDYLAPLASEMHRSHQIWSRCVTFVRRAPAAHALACGEGTPCAGILTADGRPGRHAMAGRTECWRVLTHGRVHCMRRLVAVKRKALQRVTPGARGQGWRTVQQAHRELYLRGCTPGEFTARLPQSPRGQGQRRHAALPEGSTGGSHQHCRAAPLVQLPPRRESLAVGQLWQGTRAQWSGRTVLPPGQ